MCGSVHPFTVVQASDACYVCMLLKRASYACQLCIGCVCYQCTPLACVIVHQSHVLVFFISRVRLRVLLALHG